MTEPSRAGRSLRLLAIDPALASLWLQTANTRNRRMDRSRVAEYVKAMRTGRWKLSNDAIAFDHDGVLINGQKRLQAVVDSGMAQVFAVMEGCDPEDQNVMDVGQGRKAGQQLTIHGWKNGNVAAAIVRALLRWHGAGMAGNYRPSIDEIAEFANNHAARLEVATDVAARVARKVPISRSLIGAACFTAYDLAVDRPAELPVEIVSNFFEMLETGASMEADHPVMVLRERAIRYKTHALGSRRVNQTDAEQLYDIVRTWNGYRLDERYSKLQPPKGAITADKLKMK